MAKHADDATLLVSEKTDVQIHDEFNSIRKWATDNKLTINLSKTGEVIFYRPTPRNYLPPTELNGLPTRRGAAKDGLLVECGILVIRRLKGSSVDTDYRDVKVLIQDSDCFIR